MLKRSRLVLTLGFLCLCFFLRGLFYCVLLPVWEGYDEWAHFAQVQYISQFGRLPDRTSDVSGQIEASLHLVPLSASAADLVPGAVTHDAFWQLSEQERLRRERQFAQICFPNSAAGAADLGLSQYEAQQPPLYYLLASTIYGFLGKEWCLQDQILGLRLLSLAIACMVVPLGYGIARRLVPNRRVPILTAALLTSLPGLYIDVCRAGNESLAIVLTSAVLLCSLRVLERDCGLLNWLQLAFVLSAALLTKAYVLAFVPLIVVIALLRIVRFRRDWKNTLVHLTAAFSVIAALSGWWYWRSWSLTGTLSGEQLDIAAATFGTFAKIQAALKIDWLGVMDSAAFSHIWVGGWSFLTVRRWMYRVFEYLAGGSFVGLSLAFGWTLWRYFQKGRASTRSWYFLVLASAYLLFCGGMAYHAVVIFLVTGKTAAAGWYLYAVVTAEVCLLVLGATYLVSRRWITMALAAVIVLLTVFELYTVHFLLAPYYGGVIAHRSSGPLAAFHLIDLERIGGFSKLLGRLAVNESSMIGPNAIAIVWAIYLLAIVLTLFVVANLVWKRL